MHRTVTTLAAALTLFASACAQGLPVYTQVTPAPIPAVIVETDMGGDSDDAAALAFMHHLADRREIELLAVMHNGNNEWGGAAISAINTYYGRPELPIGTYRTAAEAGRPEYHPLVDRNQPNGPRRHLSYTGPTTFGRWVKLLAETYPCAYKTRLEFPDAVDVYRDVLPLADDHTVVIFNAGYLGNLSNLLGWLDADPVLSQLFDDKVLRMTGAVGGTNTCAPFLPEGLAEHVVNNPAHPMPVLTWLGGPEPGAPPYTGPPLMETDATFGANLAIDNPVREAYRYKTEVEQGKRGTSSAWRWHIIDVVIGFGTVAWDRMTDSFGNPYYTLLSAQQWVDVLGNCGAVGVPGPAPLPTWDFQAVAVRPTQGRSLADVVRSIRRRLLDDGLYRGPANPWAPEREHRAITAMFEDGTFGGFDQAAAFDSWFENGRLVVPTYSRSVGLNNAALVTEGRRYDDQTVLVRVARLPDVSKYPPADTSAASVEVAFWADTRNDVWWGAAPRVRLQSWPGRGPSSPGRPVHRVEVWDVTPQGYQRVAAQDVTHVALGEELTLRVEVDGSTVQCAVDGVDCFATPVALVSAPPAEGGFTNVSFNAYAKADRFDIDWVLVRPRAGDTVIPDVFVDKAGDVWFSLLRNGDLAGDLFGAGMGASTHFVEFVPSPQRGLPSGPPLRIDFPQWLPLALAHETHGIGSDHWVYGLRGVPWVTGDGFVLEYRGLREGERVVTR